MCQRVRQVPLISQPLDLFTHYLHIQSHILRITMNYPATMNCLCTAYTCTHTHPALHIPTRPKTAGIPQSNTCVHFPTIPLPSPHHSPLLTLHLPSHRLHNQLRTLTEPHPPIHHRIDAPSTLAPVRDRAHPFFRHSCTSPICHLRSAVGRSTDSGLKTTGSALTASSVSTTKEVDWLRCPLGLALGLGV